MQLLDLPLAIGFGVPADAGIEGARRVLQQLLLPGIDLVGMDLVALGKVGHRRLFPNRFQRDLRLQGAVNLASRLRHPLLRLSNGAADFQLSPWSQKRGPFHLRMIARLIEARKLSISCGVEWRSTTRKSARRVG